MQDSSRINNTLKLTIFAESYARKIGSFDVNLYTGYEGTTAMPISMLLKERDIFARPPRYHLTNYDMFAHLATLPRYRSLKMIDYSEKVSSAIELKSNQQHTTLPP